MKHIGVAFWGIFTEEGLAACFLSFLSRIPFFMSFWAVSLAIAGDSEVLFALADKVGGNLAYRVDERTEKVRAEILTSHSGLLIRPPYPRVAWSGAEIQP